MSSNCPEDDPFTIGPSVDDVYGGHTTRREPLPTFYTLDIYVDQGTDLLFPLSPRTKIHSYVKGMGLSLCTKLSLFVFCFSGPQLLSSFEHTSTTTRLRLTRLRIESLFFKGQSPSYFYVHSGGVPLR